ncbi:MAG: hypothetical protein K0B15_04560 [Lentimicrobium sp.]|nr:hypothetical protein [Lentimicrobium sp.]
MEELFKAFGTYIKMAEFNSLEFWIYPLGNIFVIWLLTTLGLKIIPQRKNKLKTVFRIHNFWICSALILATAIISLICFWWATNYFAEKPLQLALLISLFLALLVPIITLLNLRSYFTTEDIKEIAEQPKTPTQFEATLTETKKAFRKKKFCYFILLAGFLFLLFSLNTGSNLISIVFDNSGSMESNNSIEALSETFDNLSKNNEIVLTTLEGLGANSTGGKNSMSEILSTKNYSQLQAGNVVYFTDPVSAKSGLNQITNQVWGSPISESIWKSYLFVKTNLANNSYKNKVLIVITDGDDNVGNSIPKSKFFFDDDEFATYFTPDRTFIIDYSYGATNPFLQKFQDAGCETFVVTNTKQDYLDALGTTLNSFKNNRFIIIWVIIIASFLTLIALLIEPKKIV